MRGAGGAGAGSGQPRGEWGERRSGQPNRAGASRAVASTAPHRRRDQRNRQRPVAGPLAGQPTLAPLSPRAKVRMGVTDATVNGPMFIGMDRGYFTEVGLEIEDNRFDGVTRMMQPLAAGQSTSSARRLRRGCSTPWRATWTCGSWPTAARESPGRSESALVVRQDLWESGAVRSLPDLRGLRVAVPGVQAGSALALELGHGLEAQGMTMDDVDAVDLATPEAKPGSPTAA